jgi:hypothetical protein
MTIPNKKLHVSHEDAEKIKETTDMLGGPLKEGDIVMVFRDSSDSFSGIKETRTLMGVVKHIQVYPTTIGEVTIEHYKLTEDERRESENSHWKDEKTISRFYNNSVLGMTVLREAMPEYFL